MIKLNEGEESVGETPILSANEEHQKQQQHERGDDDDDDDKTDVNKRDQVEVAETFPPLISSEYKDESDDKNSRKIEDDKNDVLRFTMLFNKVSSDFNFKRNSKANDDVEEKLKKDVKGMMFFNSEVTIRSDADHDSETPIKNLEPKKLESSEKDLEIKTSPKFNRNNSVPKFAVHKSEILEYGKPQFSEPGMMFSSSLTFSSPEVFCEVLPRSKSGERENLNKFFYKRNPQMENEIFFEENFHYPSMRGDLRTYNSLTTLQKSSKFGSKGSLKSKIPSLTAIETESTLQRTRTPRYTYWDAWNDFVLAEKDTEKRLNLQISKSSNDNNRRMTLRFKKDDAASASDSKLLYGDFESKKQIKKCDKKSRGDSRKKDKESGNRKQVQWKTEVDVIYFSTHLASNGDRTGEVIGRVMEPLREEWEQQRKGFYAKMVPYHMESHIKDRFISLLKI